MVVFGKDRTGQAVRPVAVVDIPFAGLESSRSPPREVRRHTPQARQQWLPPAAPVRPSPASACRSPMAHQGVRARVVWRSPRQVSRALDRPLPQHEEVLNPPQREAPERRRGRRLRCCRAECRQVGATNNYRAGASAVRGQVQLALPDCFRRVLKGLNHVLCFQIRIQREDLLGIHALRDHLDDHRNRDAKAANARSSSHLIGADGDAGRRHEERLACQIFPELPALPRDCAESDQHRDGRAEKETRWVHTCASPSERSSELWHGKFASATCPSGAPRLESKWVARAAPLKLVVECAKRGYL
jgi:hypothetical protein